MEMTLACCCGTCDKKWTPTRLPCNYSTIAMAGFDLTIEDNPFSPLLNNEPLGIPLDGMVGSPVESWGGGPIGFFEVEASTVRLHRYCDWSDGSITELTPFESIVGETYQYDVNAEKAPKRFIFGDGIKAPLCNWIDTGTQIITDESQEIGIYGAAAETIDVELVFDRVPYTPIGVRTTKAKRVDKVLRNSGTDEAMTEDEVVENGLSTNIVELVFYHNGNVGLSATAIDGIDADDLVFNPPSLLSPAFWAPPYPAAHNGNITDYDVDSGDPPTMTGFTGDDSLNQIMSRPAIIPGGAAYNSGNVEAGRSVSASATLASFLSFSNGDWTVGGSLSLYFDSRSATYYTASIVSRVKEVGDEVLLPFSNAGVTTTVPTRIEFLGTSGGVPTTFYFDLDELEVTNPSTGTWVSVADNTAPTGDAAGFDWLWDIYNGADGEIFDYDYAAIETLYGLGATVVGISELLYRGIAVRQNPQVLGTDTIVVRFTPHTENTSKTEFQRWNVFSESIYFGGLPGYTLETSAEDRSAMRRTTDDVVIDDAVAYGEKVVQGDNETNKFHTVGSYAVATSGPHGSAVGTFISDGAAGELTRSCRCASFWIWTNSGFGPYAWVLTDDGCGAGRTAVPPDTDGSPGETREGTCEID